MTRPAAIQPRFVRLADAPTMFGIGRTLIYEMAKRGEFQIYKAGNASLLKVEEVEAAIRPRPAGLGG